MDLNRNWMLRFTHPETGAAHCIPAAVPGNVELDLVRAGLLVDPLPPDDVHAGRWVEWTDWEYETKFDFDALPAGSDRAELVFGGIDTAAEILLNGETVGRCANMFIEHRFDVTGKLRCGENRLVVRITAPETAARKFPPTPPFHWSCFPDSVYLRKARHMWGWDNAPHRLSAGLWRGVSLEFPPAIRFDSVYVYTEVIDPERDTAELGCRYRFVTPDRNLSGYRVRVRLTRGGSCVLDRRFAVSHTDGILDDGALVVKHPALWYPVGTGDAPLYDFALTLEKDGTEVARHSHKVGIRRIRLERTETTTPEGAGEFQFYCNGRKIYIRGTNWKPLSPFHSQTPEKLERALNLILECNCNMVRVWGGGVYEDHAFFDFCDEHGILVWQDFMIACEFPPQEEFFLREMAHEAESVIVKLRNHPSLALWCGDNETDVAFFWGNKLNRNLLPSHNRVTREVLPRAVRNFDPARDFLPSSPYIADSLIVRRYREQPMSDTLERVPEQHLYTAGPELPEGGFRAFFRSSAAHFISETGPIGVNAMSETPELVARELSRLRRLWNVDPDSVIAESGMMMHQSDRYCAVWCRTARQVTERMFGRKFSPDAPEELVAAVNFYVASLFKYIVESYRMQKFRRSGVIWWSLLDMWPMAFNYSVTDSEFRRKLPFDVIRLSQQPLALMAREPETGEEPAVLCAVNDTLNVCEGRYSVAAEDGTLLREETFRVGANQVAELGELPASPGDFRRIDWKCKELAGANYYLAPAEVYDFDRCRRLAESFRNLARGGGWAHDRGGFRGTLTGGAESF